MEYRILWEIDLDADSPRAAARLAWEIMQRPGSTANVFTVIDSRGQRTQVDLLEAESCEAQSCENLE